MSHRSRRVSATTSGRAGNRFAFLVMSGDDGWVLKTPDGERTSRVYKTQAEAIEAAKQAVRAQGGVLQIHGKSGRVRELVTLGREPFARIGAVEGIQPTRASEARAEKFERSGLTADERRRAIIDAHRPKD